MNLSSDIDRVRDDHGQGEPVVLTEDGEHVRLITLNRPDKLNAFNAALFAGLGRALRDAAEDPQVHVVVITGAGRAFSAGADLNDMGKAGSGDGPAESDTPNPFDELQAVAENFPKPLISAINGIGAGLGFTFLSYCDFGFVAESARVRTPFVHLGLSPEASSSYLFPLRMGWQLAAVALLAGEWFDAERIVQAGLALEITPDGQVVDVAMDFARKVASGSLESLVATKALMLEAFKANVTHARELEKATLARLVGSEANRAAVQAFAAKQR